MPQLGDLNHRNLFSHSSGGWKFKIKVLAGLASPEVSLTCRRLPSHLVFLVYVCVHVLISSHKSISRTGPEAMVIASF